MSERRNHLVLVALLLLALAGVAFIGLPGSPGQKQARLGLDLQGGLEVVLKAAPPPGHKLTAADLDRAVTVIRNRVDKLGVSETEIRKQGANEIVIELPGVKDPGRVEGIIGSTAQLEFYDLEADLLRPSIDAQGFPIAKATLIGLLEQVPAGGEPGRWYLFDAKRKLKAGPAISKAGALGKRGGEVPKGWKLLTIPKDSTVIMCGPPTVVCPGVQSSPTQTTYYLFKYQPDNATKPIPEMSGKDLKLRGTRADNDPTSGEPIVLMQFTGHGAKVFHDITRTEAQRGRFRSGLVGQDVQQHFAIVLDRQIRTFPQIDFHNYPDGIEGSNGAQITGLASGTEAKDIALVLQTGALPVKFITAERTDVSATLGKDSLNQAKKAALVGLLVVALFLLLLYRFLGLVAVIGLAIYAAFLYAAILIFGVTLTLPGFAGLILTIGVAADANVVIFERIKEEVRSGKSMRAAISHGYGKGFHTILDANVVTAITALVLFAVATAGVKGFALMLLIGTLISLVTAVAATRAMLGLLAGFRWFDNPQFMGAQGVQGLRFLRIDYMARRYLWFAISGAIVVIGIGSLAVRGLNFGIDFKGGTQVTFKTNAKHTTGDVSKIVTDLGYPSPVVQGRGAQAGTLFTSFQVRTRALSGSQLTGLQTAFKEKVGASASGAQTVSSSFGRQIAKLAILAIIVSLLLIVFYIAIRFDFKFALPVIIALAHDVVITVGVYSLTHREVSTATVAAVLTVLGYSIYDTIIIFDRIRENIPLMRRQSFATIANVSLWETIRRSLATTFITLLPILSLLLFGGTTLKDFAFALLVGITAGAYSSIFIAAPLLTMWKERDPEYMRRLDVPMESAEGDRVVEEAEIAAADEPTPALAPVGAGERADDEVRRERRRQRRKARPHGRAR